MDKITVIGNLGRDPEMRYTPEGTPVVNFSVASNRTWTDASGEKHEQTVWYRVSVWRRMAEVCNQYLAKGRQVYIEGQLRADPETGGPRVFQRNDGTYGAAYEVTAQTVQFLGGRNGSSDAAGEPALGEPAEQEEVEDSIPF